MEIDGRVVWLSGASSGIGAELAVKMAARGARLILSAPDTERASLDNVAARCDGAQVRVLPLDLTRYDDLPGIVVQAESIHGAIDVLVNNAGVSQRAELVDTDREVMLRLMAVNFLGPAVLTRLVLPGMIRRRSGHIVGTTSLAGKTGAPLRTMYSAAKHAQHGFYDSLRAEVWRHGIRVTLVVPGFVRTDISRHAVTGDGSPNRRMSRNQAAGMSPDRCAGVILRAVERDRQEVFTAMGLKGRTVYALKILFPRVLARILAKTDVS